MSACPVSYELLGMNGRLGNQLFQIASTVGLARARGSEPRFPVWEYQPFFSCPDEWFTLDPAFLHVDAPQLATTLDPRTRSYLQDLALFADVEDTVRDAFKPSHRALAEVDRWEPYRFLMTEERETIALHVRRTDLLQKPWANPPLPVEYYRHALQGLPEAALLVIFGDDPEWERNLSQQLGREATIVSGTPRIAADWIGREAYNLLPPAMDWLDFFLMIECDYHVIANSTYSWWAAWLARDKETRYPKPWFGPVLEEYCDERLILPPEWTEIVWR